MSLLINDELIWVAIPRCASHSIEGSLLSSNLKIKKSNFHNVYKHPHVPVNQLYEEFGIKETVCISRDFFDRWMSGFESIFKVIEKNKKYKLKIDWKDIDNDFIYSIFNADFINKLYSQEIEIYKDLFSSAFLKNHVSELVDEVPYQLSTLLDPIYFKELKSCTYEFNVNEMDKFVNFIENRFGEKLIIEKKNTTTNRPNKIIMNNELKQFIYSNFQIKLEKTKKTLL